MADRARFARLETSGGNTIAQGIHGAVEDFAVPEFPIQAGNYDRRWRVAALNQQPESAGAHAIVVSGFMKIKRARGEVV
jgi:hypothetical protein